MFAYTYICSIVFAIFTFRVIIRVNLVPRFVLSTNFYLNRKIK